MGRSIEHRPIEVRYKDKVVRGKLITVRKGLLFGRKVKEWVEISYGG